MKDYNKESLEAERPKQIGGHASIMFALERLYADSEHEITEEIVDGLTFEELIGALLLARDTVEQQDEYEEWLDEQYR